MSDRRLIEEAMPLREVSLESVREKSVRHGHISTLHVWWARRPLAACRAVVLESLIRDPENDGERRKLHDFIVKFCTWEASNDSELVKEARRLILNHNAGSFPKVLDSFAGGGSIPLEASRIGCESYALELNPVAVLIELCTLVYPQKYGKPFQISSMQTNIKGESTQWVSNRLAYDVQKWGKWIFENVKEQISAFYPTDPEGSVPLAYLWARTLPCPNPACGAQVPLIKQLWLAKSRSRKVALRLVPSKPQKAVKFEIAEGDEIDFDPANGTIRLGSMQCPVCGEGTLNKFAIKRIAREKGFGVQPLAVMVLNPRGSRRYRLFNSLDINAFSEACKAWEKLGAMKVSGLQEIPNEVISTDYDWVLKPPMFGLSTWGQLFNPRQAIALTSFARLVSKVYENVQEESGDEDYAKAVATYLAFALDKVADRCSSVCIWNVRGQKVEHVFGRQAIPMAWDYAEANPIGGAAGDWNITVEWLCKIIDSLSSVTFMAMPKVLQGNATKLPYPSSFFDAVIIDPPYYDAVPYADLSDFFYVWLKRTIGPYHQELFRTPMTPKTEEIVQQSGKVTSAPKRKKDKEFFERKITEALTEVNRVIKPDGICAVVFAHKTTAAWETLIAALLAAGLSVTASWPMHTERPGRLRAYQSAVLASSVWLVCRKKNPDQKVGSWKTVQSKLDERVRERLDYFLGQGIKGADALLSAIGPALEVFGRYQKVEKITGDVVTVTEFLDKVRESVARHALSTVLSEQSLGNVDSATAFYVLWKWTFEPSIKMINASIEDKNERDNKKIGNGAKTLVPFDDALKLARSVGAEIDVLLKARLLKQEKEYVRMLAPLERKDIHGLGESARAGTPPAIIDMVHHALILWANQEHGKLEEYLQTSGAVANETFWRVAQALSNLLPLQSKEKQLLDGLLARQAGGVSETGRPAANKTLDEFMMGKEVK